MGSLVLHPPPGFNELRWASFGVRANASVHTRQPEALRPGRYGPKPPFIPLSPGTDSEPVFKAWGYRMGEDFSRRTRRFFAPAAILTDSKRNRRGMAGKSPLGQRSRAVNAGSQLSSSLICSPPGSSAGFCSSASSRILLGNRTLTPGSSRRRSWLRPKRGLSKSCSLLYIT